VNGHFGAFKLTDVVISMQEQLPAPITTLFLADLRTGVFKQIADAISSPIHPLSFDSQHFLPRSLSQSQTYTLHELRKIADDVLPIADAEWDATITAIAPVEIIIPIHAHGQLIAFVTIGPHTDNRPYTDEDRTMMLMVANRQALTLEYAHMIEKLQSDFEQQQERERRKDTFIAIMNHELRTPLAGMMGYVELLQSMSHVERQAQSEQVDYLIDSTATLVNELDSLMTSLQDVNAQLNSSVQAQPQLLNLCAEFRSVAKTVDMAFNSALPPRIIVKCDEQVTLWADVINLRRILTNLLSNALKYSPETEPVILQAIVQPDLNLIECTVQDRGDGIDPNEQEHIYESFYRLKHHADSPIRGTGLGLYVTWGLVEKIGGRLWVESTGVKGEGSTFHFTVPASPPTTERDILHHINPD